MKIVSIMFLLFILSKTYAYEDFQYSSPVQQSQPVEFDTISGPLPSFVSAQKGPYLVISNIEVTPEQTVTIEEGTVFLFSNFTSLRVRGRLVAIGTSNKPIIFTSVNNRIYNSDAPRDANPYDWDGIYMTPDAMGTQLSFCVIQYSVYSLLSETRFIRLQPLLFRENGSERVTIQGEEYPISNEPFSYVLEQKDATIDGVPIKLFRDPLSRKRNVTRYVSLCATVGALASGGIFLHQTKLSRRTLEARSDTAFVNTNPHKKRDWEKARKELNRNATFLTVSMALALLGSAGFYWTFNF